MDDGWDAFINNDPILALLKDDSNEVVTEVKLICSTQSEGKPKDEKGGSEIINEKYKFKLKFSKKNRGNHDLKQEIKSLYKKIFYTIIPKSQNAASSKAKSDGIGESFLMNSDWERTSCSNEDNIINLYTLREVLAPKKRVTLKRPDLILGCNRTLNDVKKEFIKNANENYHSLTVQCPQGCLAKRRESRVFGAGVYSNTSSICL